MKLIKYYTLAEVFGEEPFESTPTDFSDFVGAYLTFPFTNTEKVAINLLWKNYILPRFWDWYCIREEYPIQSAQTLTNTAITQFLYRVLSILKNTYERYSIIIGYYGDAIEILMDQVKTKTISRFNDTPQESGEFSEDEHTTNLTEAESFSDYNTPIERLDEIRRKFANVMKEWSDEFKGLFYEMEG